MAEEISIDGSPAATARAVTNLLAAIAELVALIGPGGGGGLPGTGAGIDDDVTATDTTWSSQKSSTELAKKADVGHSTYVFADPANGFDGVLLEDIITQISSMAGSSLSFDPASSPSPATRVVFCTEIPAEPRSNTLYAVRASDGSVTWHLPVL